MASLGGLVVEPAGAAAFAGLAPALQAGLIGTGETIVVLVTGSGLKTPQHLHPARRPVQVRAEIAEVEAALAVGA